MLELLPINQGRIDEYSNLLTTVFNKSFFTKTYLHWQYFENPNGAAVGYDVIYNGDLVAHYACIPLELGVSRRKILLSLNTATRKDFQGKGFFTRLAQKTFDDVSETFDFVVGVANENSVHGFTRKLGFEQIGNLNLRYGPPTMVSVESHQVYYSADTLTWRLKSERGGFSLTRSNSSLYVQKKISILGPNIWQPILSVDSRLLTVPSTIQRLPRVCWSLDWSSQHTKENFFSLPKWIKPSPLHLIKLNLSSTQKSLDYFSYLDFDAY